MKTILLLLLVAFIAVSCTSDNTIIEAEQEMEMQERGRNKRGVKVLTIAPTSSDFQYTILPEDRKITLKGSIVEANPFNPAIVFSLNQHVKGTRLVIKNNANLSIVLRMDEQVIKYFPQELVRGNGLIKYLEIPVGYRVIIRRKVNGEYYVRFKKMKSK